MTIPEQVQLLPCPFCGDRMEWSGDFVRHLDDKSACPIRQDGFVNAQLWNTRHTATADALEAMREALCVGDKVAVIGQYEADWQGIDTWITGINADHKGINYTIGEQWPVPHRHMSGYLGMTDGFREGELTRLTAALATLEGDTK